ncbi:MAG TPA: hypothetical protein VH107_18495 [Lacipirellulaceae bacterium]|jgi:uncharacterized membrane protein YciS (DUF1049 family)|nr:hypothetical protein [Lacipirellulaceae bacterium]
MPNKSRLPLLAAIYAATIFISAFLLFQIEPMVSKAILPWFGGTPAVWTTCLLFFQTALFAGYAYAHVTNTNLSRPRQALVHVGLLVVALVLLRALPGPNWQPKGDEDPTLRILLMLALTIGLPYFVLSSTGPLLQAWFAHSFPGRSPYRLYALSNVGSLLALISYPFLFERFFDLPHQAMLWSIGFIVFAILCGFAALQLRAALPADSADIASESTPVESTSAAAPGSLRYLFWLILPAFASAVLMATTNHVSTDVAVVPLLWVVPLALYLLTFIIAFDRPAWYSRLPVAVITLFAIYASALAYKEGVGKIDLYECGMTGMAAQSLAETFHLGGFTAADKAISPQFPVSFLARIVVNFIAMFGICFLCHGELARLKPTTRYLTAYYLMISAGGAIGGLAVSIIAPRVFDTMFEWNLCTFLAALAAVGIVLYWLVSRSLPAAWELSPAERELPQSELQKTRRSQSRLVPRVLLALVLVPMAFILLDLSVYLFTPRKLVVFESRNFFGTLTIREKDRNSAAKDALELLNGTTIHGSQFKNPQRHGEPTSYYSPQSGIGRVLQFYSANRPPGGVRVGDVGLGTGTLAAYLNKGDFLTFYEINPAVIQMSTSGDWFTYVPDCRQRGAHCDIKLGDARLTLAREVDTPHLPRYHVLVLDAFSGDAVPTHLLTAEAYDIYLPRLATEAVDGAEGALVVHVSNRYLDLARVVRATAEKLQMPYVEIHSPGNAELLINGADWIVLTRNQALLDDLKPAAYIPKDPKPPVLWTDARSSLFEIIK